jgi:lysyl-tRNA synthetase class 2
MVRSVLAPAAGGHGHDERQNRAARAIIWQHGQDSLSPFLLRPDKALHFDFDGVLSYRVIGGTAVVSGDPVGPPGAAPRVLSSFLDLARERGWKVAVWGASWRHLSAYRGLGLRALQAGEEAFVDPRSFTLQGRRVRKLRQSVHRLTRRGWQLQTYEGRALAPDVEAEVDAVERSWRAGRTHLIGFAMGMGAFDPDVRPDDLYLLARSPEGDLRGVMRFAAHCGRLSLDTMRRVGETPNGLNEAMVCRALEWAGERGIDEVSLNYAGLAHLARAGRTRRLLSSAILSVLGSRFQLERLVRFNQKFSPTWRPRFLIYQSRVGLPLTLLRVLQAEGYLPAPGSPARLRPRDRKRSPAGSAPARAAG